MLRLSKILILQPGCQMSFRCRCQANTGIYVLQRPYNHEAPSGLPPGIRYNRGHMLTRLKTFFRQQFFNLRYFRQPPWDTGISPPELIAFIEAHAPGRALDLGCGTATNVITLARHGWQVTGVDFAGRAIQAGRRKVAQAEVTAQLLQADVTRLENLAGPFDLILDIGCLHGVLPGRRPAYFANLERLLAPGGTYLLYAFWTEGGDGSQTGLRPSDLAALQQRFRLTQRQDGSERGRRPSSWLTFERQPIRETA